MVISAGGVFLLACFAGSIVTVLSIMGIAQLVRALYRWGR